MKALWVPVVVYLVATLGVPLLHPLDARFSDHVIIVLGCTALVCATQRALGRRRVGVMAPVSPRVQDRDS